MHARTFMIVTAGALTSAASAQQLVSNGGFEASFTSWTRVEQVGSDGSFALQSGTASPVNAFPVPIAPGGIRAAMTDSQAGGSHVLYQDITIPLTVTTASLSFALYLNNGAGTYFTPTNINWAATSTTGSQVLNQQARVDFMLASADPFSTAASDVLLNVFQTGPSTPAVLGYSTMTTDITAFLQAHSGQTLRLRFAEVDNVNFFNMGVDDVSVAIPAPASAMIAAAFGCIVSRRRR